MKRTALQTKHWLLAEPHQLGTNCPRVSDASVAVYQVKSETVPDDVDAMVVLHEHDAFGPFVAFSSANAIVENGIHSIDPNRLSQFATVFHSKKLMIPNSQGTAIHSDVSAIPRSCKIMVRPVYAVERFGSIGRSKRQDETEQSIWN